MSKRLEKYKTLLDKGTEQSMSGGGELFPHVYSTTDSRFQSFKIIAEHLFKKLEAGEKINILELGTSRSFKDGAYEGCLVADRKYWDPENYEEWDWGAGVFTVVLAQLLEEANANPAMIDFCTIDSSQQACYISSVMTENFEFVNVFHCTSEQALSGTVDRWDVIYMDTADFGDEQHLINAVGPLHLSEAQLIVETDILKADGLILIDDVKNSSPSKVSMLPAIAGLGKSFLSIPYLKEQGFKVTYEGYQFVMSR